MDADDSDFRRVQLSSNGDFSFMPHTQPLWESEGPKALSARALASICRNILEKPTQLRYRRLRAANPNFVDRISRWPGALAVLRAIGFVSQTYHDGEYWVLHYVNAALLQAVLRECELGLETAARMQRAHAADTPGASAMDAPNQTPADEEGHEAHPVSVEGDHALDAADMLIEAQSTSVVGRDMADRSAHTFARQLQARAIVHRVVAQQQEQRRQRWRRAAGCLAVLLLAAVVYALRDEHLGVPDDDAQ